MFMLAQLVAKITGDQSGLNSAVDAAKTKMDEVKTKATEVGAKKIGTLGSPALAAGLRKAHEAADGLKGQLLTIAGIDLEKIAKLFTIGGMVAALGIATKKFIDLESETVAVQTRFKMLGLETEENTKKLWAFAAATGAAYNMKASDVRGLAASAMNRGVDPSRYQTLVKSAIGLSGALGIGATQAERIVEQLEAGNYQILRRMHPAFRQLIDAGAGRFAIEQKVNEMIAKGGEAAKERANTTSGQLNRLQNSFVSLGNTFSQVIGPVLQPVIRRIADAVENFNSKLQDLMKNHAGAMQSSLKFASAIGAGFLALRYGGTAISKLVKLLGFLVPGFGVLSSVAGSALGGFGLFGRVARGIFGAVKGGLFGVIAVSKLTGMGIFKGLTSPIGSIKALFGGLFAVLKAGFLGTGTAGGIASFGVRLFSTALKGLLAATGVGLILAFIASILEVGDTFGNMGTGLGALGDEFKRVWAEIQEAMQPVINWLEREGVIVFKALIAGLRNLWAVAQETWAKILEAAQPVVEWLSQAWDKLLKWLGTQTGSTIGDLSDLWAEFTAELTVIGYRVQQGFLFMAIGISVVVDAVKWLKDVFKAFGEWLSQDWVHGMIEGLKLFNSAVNVVGMAVEDLGQNIIDALSGKEAKWDFSETEKAFDKLKNQAKSIFGEMKLPEFETSDTTKGLIGDMDELNRKIDETKQRARDAQNRDRTNWQNRNSGKTGGGDDIKGGVRVGGRDKAHFTDPTAFWKKLQEAAASQRVEEVAARHLAVSEEMKGILTDIRNQGGVKPPADKGVVPG